MSRGRVLVIDDDEWVCRLLAVAMKEFGFEITITENAAEGFYKAVEEQPDCIVCDVDLPDHNGYWVAKKIRSHPSRIATAPFVFLSGLDDREHRLEGFQVGGDAYLTKPFRIDEVVAQVDALIQMAARLNNARVARASIPPPQVAMHGDLAQLSLGTLLTLLDLERRSGALELKSEGKTAEFNIMAGSIASTTLNGTVAPPLETTRKAMSWMSGKFAFTPTEDRLATVAEQRKARMSLSGDEQGTSINALLMEAARLEDEERNEEGDKPSSSRHAAAWKETLARHTPRPFAAVTGALTESSSNIFASRPPPSSGRGPLPPLDSIMAPPARSENDVETFEPPAVTPRPATTSAPSAAMAPAAVPAIVSPSPLAVPAAVPLPRFAVRPAAGTPASAPPSATPPPAVTATSAPPPAPTFGPRPASIPPAAAPAAVALAPPPPIPHPPGSVPGAIPAPPLASRFQGGRTQTLSGAAARPMAATPGVSGTPGVPPARPSSAPDAPATGGPAASGAPSTSPPTAPTAARMPAATGTPAARPAGLPSAPAKPPVPGPRTAFGAKLRSLSPSKPMRAVTPPSPPIAPATKPITPPEIDAGWSAPPSAPSIASEDLELDDLFDNENPPSKPST